MFESCLRQVLIQVVSVPNGRVNVMGLQKKHEEPLLLNGRMRRA